MWGWRPAQAQEDEDDERCDALMVRLQAEIEEAEARSPIPVWDGTSGLTKGSEEELALLVQAAADEERRLRSQAAAARGGGSGAAAGRPREGSTAGGSSSTSLARGEGPRSARGSPASGADPGSLAPLPPRPRSAGGLHRAGSAPPAPPGSRSASSSRPASPWFGPSSSDSAVAGLGDATAAGGDGLGGAGLFRGPSGGDRSAPRCSAPGGPTGSRARLPDPLPSSSSLSGASSAAAPAPLSTATPSAAAPTPPPAAAPVRPSRPRTRAEAMAALRRVDLADVDAVWAALEAALDAEDAAAWGGRVRAPPGRPGAVEGGAAAGGAAPPRLSAASREEAALKRCLAKRDLRGAFSHAISGEGACPPGLGRDRRRFSLLAAVLRARRG